MLEAMLRIRDTITNNWKKMRRTFRLLDPTAEGAITTNQFRDTLRQFSNQSVRGGVLSIDDVLR